MASAIMAQSQPAGTTAPVAAAAPDAQALLAMLEQLQGVAVKAETDVAHLQIDRWKTDSTTRQQTLTTSDSIRRNLNYAVPELIQNVRTTPGSLSANFRLYRNLNALYETFSLLVASAETYAGRDQYIPIESDLSQLESLRRQFAERTDQLTASGDAELTRARTHPPVAAAAKAPTRIVVDDGSPKPKKTTKTTSSQPQTTSH
jgi:hypothetical protein